jgi:hypothetical protein
MKRRSFLEDLVRGGATLSLAGFVPPEAKGVATPAGPTDTFPRQALEAVSEVVFASHSDLAKVRRIVEARPALAKASWDWGFGDWETPIDAASHTGQREIALFLLGSGARKTLFCAAMLGELELVKALVDAQPDVRRGRGPHSISLLAHARAGGEPAKKVLAYLESLGDADMPTSTQPSDAPTRGRYVGTYSFGAGAADRLEVSENREALRIARTGGTPRPLWGTAPGVFFPAGAPSVQIRFDGDGPKASRLSVVDDALRVVATRIA